MTRYHIEGFFMGAVIGAIIFALVKYFGGM